MESSLSKSKQRSPLIWRILFHPMLYISILVHGLVLAIPSQPEPEIDPEELEEEQEIDITSLAPIVKPLPEPEETPPPQPAPSQQTAPAQQQAAIPPQPQVIQTPAPEPSVAPADPNAAVSPTPTPTPTPFDPTQSRGQIASGFESSDRYFAPGENPPPNFYRNPEAYFEDPSARPPTLRPGIIGGRAIMLNNVDLSQTEDEGEVIAFRPEDYLPDDVKLTRLYDYGGGPLYEVETQDGELIGYLNATPAKAGASTIVMLWEYNPNSPPSDVSSAN